MELARTGKPIDQPSNVWGLVQPQRHYLIGCGGAQISAASPAASIRRIDGWASCRRRNADCCQVAAEERDSTAMSFSRAFLGAARPLLSRWGADRVARLAQCGAGHLVGSNRLAGGSLHACEPEAISGIRIRRGGHHVDTTLKDKVGALRAALSHPANFGSVHRRGVISGGMGGGKTRRSGSGAGVVTAAGGLGWSCWTSHRPEDHDDRGETATE